MSDHIPVQRIDLGAGTCFKLGFMAALGFFTFGLIMSLIGLLLSVILGLVFGASLLPFLQGNG